MMIFDDNLIANTAMSINSAVQKNKMSQFKSWCITVRQNRFRQKVLSWAKDFQNLNTWSLNFQKNHITKSSHIIFFSNLGVPNGDSNPWLLKHNSGGYPPKVLNYSLMWEGLIILFLCTLFKSEVSLKVVLAQLWAVWSGSYHYRDLQYEEKIQFQRDN